MPTWFQSAGAFGKLPSQGDFVRVGGTPPAVQALDQWLQEGLEGIRRGGGSFPDVPLSFLFRGAGVREALIGVLGRSGDSVGRAFPLAVYGIVDGPSVASRFPLVPVACARFLGAATKIVQSAAGLTAADLAAQVAALPSPTETDVSVADDLRKLALMQGRSHEILERAFAGTPNGTPYYAIRTFLSACEAARGQESDRPGITLTCPVTSELDRLTWLELAARLLRWQKGPPTLLWSDPPPSRILISIGPAPAGLLVYWVKPDPAATKLWPLTTDRPDAIMQAHQALRPQHRSALESDLELERFLGSLAG